MDTLRSIKAFLGSGARPSLGEHPETRPFITISREAGIDGGAVMHSLLERLREQDPGDPPWTGWHRELAERVAREHGVSEFLAANLIDQDHGLLRDLLEGFSLAGDYANTEVAVYHRMAATLRAVARAGRAVIVGCGGVLLTRDMHAGIHLRLVAPMWWRVMRHAQRQAVSDSEARNRVAEIDRNREAFYRKYFPLQPLEPSTFTATFNVAEIDHETLVDAAAKVVLSRIVDGKPVTA